MRSIFLSSLAAPLLLGFTALADTNVHVLSGGFKVQELPIKLSNINNLRFSPSGELTALGYDGQDAPGHILFE